MSYIKSLGYIGIGAEDLDAWRTFGTEVLGLQVGTAPQGDDALYLRMDGRAYRIAVHPGTNGAVHYVGFEIGTRQGLAELATDLRSKGIAMTDEPAEVCAARRVAAMQSTTDPAGNRIEFFVGHEEATAPFISPTGAKFVIDDMGFGHGFFMVDDIDAFLGFYVDTLGFRLSDTIGFMPGVAGYFLHCNPRDHSIAGAAIPGAPSMLQHIMLQVQSIDSVGHAYDKVVADDIPIMSTLGKHTNDHMISFYCVSPSGLAVEYGIEGRRVDDETWVVGHYTAASYWGHKQPVPA